MVRWKDVHMVVWLNGNFIGHPIEGLQVVKVPLELHLHRGVTWSLSVRALLVEDLRRPSK